MPGLFISYRRIDTKAYAGRLFDHLSREFGAGRVFMDVEGGIARGEDFEAALERALHTSEAMLVLIGRRWLTCQDEGGRRRLDNPTDWVRTEAAVALRRGIPVLPVLVDSASMPPARELPDDIRALARRQSSEVSDTRWAYDIAQIVQALRATLHSPGTAAPATLRGAAADRPRPFHNKVLCCGVSRYSELDVAHRVAFHQTLARAMRDVVGDLGLKLDEEVVALPTVDGAALNFLPQQPDLHLRAALRLLEAWPASSDAPGEVPRIGLSASIDALVFDVTGRPHIVGPGIDSAQRVMRLAAGRQILMHDDVRRELQAYAEYAQSIVARGDHSGGGPHPLPVAQFVDSALPYLNAEPLAAPALVSGPQPVDLDQLLRLSRRENLLSLTLDERALEHVAEISDYVSDFLEEGGEFQRLKVAVAWVLVELLHNAFRHRGDAPAGPVLVNVARTRSGVLVEVEQPDVPSFSLSQALHTLRSAVDDGLSFLRIADQPGLNFHQRRSGARMTVGLEMPREMAFGSAGGLFDDAVPPSIALPLEVQAFIDGHSDSVAAGNARMVRLPFEIVDHRAAKAFDETLTTLAPPGTAGGWLVLDLCRLRYVSSVGLRSLMLLTRRLAARQGLLVLAAPTAEVAEILKVARFNRVLRIFETVAAAYAASGSDDSSRAGAPVNVAGAG